MYRGFSRGPRGRMYGHRGFRPEIYAGFIGLIFFGWIIMAVIGGLFGSVLMLLGAAARGLARVLPRLFSGFLFSKSVIAGLIIGLIWYFRTHGRNMDKRNEACENSSSKADGTSAETEAFDVPACRTLHV